MELFKDIAALVFSLALLINAILFIPQMIRIWKERTAKGVSLITFLGFWLTQLAIVVHGLIKQDYLLALGYLLSMTTCGGVIFLVIYFRKKRGGYIKGEEVALEDIMKQLPGHVYWKNKDGVFLGCNTQNWQDFGFKSVGNYVGKSDYDVFPKVQADKITHTDQEVMRTGEKCIAEEESNKGDDSKALYLSHKSPLKNKHGNVIGIVGVSLDITEERQGELDRLDLLEGIIALMPGHVYWVDRSGIYKGCNDEQAKSAGLKNRMEIVGKRNKDLPWNRDNEALVIKLDEINQEVMRSGETRVVEEPAKLWGGERRIFLSSKVPLRNKSKQVIGMVGISIDVTDIKHTEKKLQETEHTLAGMTLVSASVAHELRTPLATISMGADYLNDYMSTLIEGYVVARDTDQYNSIIGDETLEDIKETPDSIEKVARAGFKFIDIMLMKIRPTLNAKKEPFSISHCVNQALSDYPFQRGQQELIEWGGDHHFVVNGSELLVTHVLYNLIKNALYYVAKAGKGGVKIWLGEQNEHNMLCFEDTGEGIDEDMLPHIFDQFFTRTAHGAGVGLSFCKMVMENLGGSISCESERGKYTRFILLFPKGNIE